MFKDLYPYKKMVEAAERGNNKDFEWFERVFRSAVEVELLHVTLRLRHRLLARQGEIEQELLHQLAETELVYLVISQHQEREAINNLSFGLTYFQDLVSYAPRTYKLYRERPAPTLGDVLYAVEPSGGQQYLRRVEHYADSSD